MNQVNVKYLFFRLNTKVFLLNVMPRLTFNSLSGWPAKDAPSQYRILTLFQLKKSKKISTKKKKKKEKDFQINIFYYTLKKERKEKAVGKKPKIDAISNIIYIGTFNMKRR